VGDQRCDNYYYYSIFLRPMTAVIALILSQKKQLIGRIKRFGGMHYI
jgi:hypothetical protein